MTNRNQPGSALHRPNQQSASRSSAKFLAFCLLFSSLVVALSENALGRTFGRLAQQPAQAPRDADNKADDEKEARLLEPGKAIQGELAGANSHTYRIRLAVGQLLKAVVEQDGIDVLTRLIGPDGEQIMEFDSERRLRGPETVEHAAEAEGDYRLVVQPRQKEAPAGAYEIRTEELRAATENDRALQEARKLYKKAVDLRNAGKYDDAQPYFEGALEIRERMLGPDHPGVSQAIHDLAVLHYYKGEYTKAEPLYRRALAAREKSLGAEHLDVAASLSNLATLYSSLGEYSKAEPLYQRALAIREKSLGPEHLEVAQCLNNLAVHHRKRGDYEKAEPLFQRALAIFEKSLGPEHPYVAYPLGNLVSIYLELWDYAKAEPLCRRALAILEKSLGPEHPDIAASLSNLATLYSGLGEYSKAEPLYQRTLAIREKSLGPEHPGVADSLNDLAILYNDLGDYVKAEPLFQRALAVREKSLGPEHSEVALSLNNLASLYSDLGDYVKAEPLYQRALAILEKSLGPEHANVASPLNNLADLYCDLGDYVKAEPLFQRALAILEKSLGPEHPDVAAPLNNLADLYCGLGDYAKAEPLYQRALAIREKSLGPEHLNVVSSLSGIARLHMAKNDVARAIAFQSRANSTSEHNLKFNLSIGSERRKLAYLALFSKQMDFTLSLHSRALPHDPQALDLAFTTLLRRKGRGLDVMASAIANLRRHATPEDQALFDQLAEARSQLATLTLRGPDTDKPETYRARLKPIEDKVEELESALSARLPDFRAQAQPVTLTAVQSALPAEGALVEFAVYTPQDPRNDKNKLPPRYLAYLLTAHGRPKWVDLGEAGPIDRAITSWRHALCNPRRTDVRRLARVVDEKVMRPALALAPAGAAAPRRLLIAPDGQLNLIPFAALVDRRGRYLIERYSISYLTSGRDLLRSPASSLGEQVAIVVANPDYNDMGDEAAARSRDLGLPPASFGAWRIMIPGAEARNRDVGLSRKLTQSAGSNSNWAQIYFPPLKGTAGEARAIKAILPQSMLISGKRATESALKQLHSPGILHIATHGFFLRDQEIELVGGRDAGSATVRSAGAGDQQIENPLLRSGLALAGANLRLSGADQGDDGVLTALEAAGLDLFGTKMVALSACDTGVGEVKNGEGVFGLRRALALAGSETQVMSLWPVSDLGTRDLMIKYYKALARGDGRGDGLRSVQLEMLKSKNRRHPFYWASFIQSGEWANLEGKR
jgi:CHAT domain-containing protein/tetratricopeptide (TPR) repeat protein